MNDQQDNIGRTFPLKDLAHSDPDTGAMVHRFIHDAPAMEQVFSYATPNASADGRYLPCYSNVSGAWQIHAIDRQEMRSIQLSAITPEISELNGYISDVPCFNREYNRVFYHDRTRIYWTSIDGKEHGWVFQAPPGFWISAMSSHGRYLAFSYIEEMATPILPNGCEAKGRPQLFYFPRSIVYAIDLETGAGEYVWGAHGYLGHVEMCPFDDNLIMFIDQSLTHWQQEVLVVDRKLVDGKQAYQVLAGDFPDYRGRTLDYIGHCFFTRDGFIAGQYVEMGGVNMRNKYTDRSEFNLVIRPDGTGKRKCKFPGHGKPCHVHCQRPDGPWVGDHWIQDNGSIEMGWLSIIHNDFIT